MDVGGVVGDYGDAEYGGLAVVECGDFCDGGVEFVSDAVFDAFDGAAFVFE